MGALLLALCQQMAAKAHTGVTIANFAAPGHWRGNHPRKDGRVVECAGLEIRYTVLRIEGSNPSFSANHKGLMLQKM